MNLFLEQTHLWFHFLLEEIVDHECYDTYCTYKKRNHKGSVII